MSHGRNQHVVPRPVGWAVVGEGNARATVVTATQQAAIQRATEIAKAQNSELLVHGRSGQIRERSSHGFDPKTRKG